MLNLLALIYLIFTTLKEPVYKLYCNILKANKYNYSQPLAFESQQYKVKLGV